MKSSHGKGVGQELEVIKIGHFDSSVFDSAESFFSSQVLKGERRSLALGYVLYLFEEEAGCLTQHNDVVALISRDGRHILPGLCEAGVGGEPDPTASLSNFVDMADGAVRESGLEPR